MLSVVLKKNIDETAKLERYFTNNLSVALRHSIDCLDLVNVNSLGVFDNILLLLRSSQGNWKQGQLGRATVREGGAQQAVWGEANTRDGPVRTPRLRLLRILRL